MIRGVIKEAAKSKIPIDFVLSDIFLVRQAEEAILNEYKHLKINKITLGRK